MSISSTTRKAGPYTGNGVQTVFAFAFKVFTSSDLVVSRAVSSVETTLALSTDYTVTLNPDQDSAPGGSITLNVALANGALLAITSNVDSLQSVVVTNAGGFFPSVFNTVFDKLTILIQQLAEKIARTVTIPVTATGVTSLQIPVLGSAVLQWSADGSSLQAVTLPDLSLSLSLPSMAGKAGQFLTNNGTVASWGVVDLTPYTLKSRNLTGGGLVTGGGDLTADRVFTVTAASASDVRTGTDTSKALTAGALMASSAFQSLTDNTTIAWACTAGYNATVTLLASGHTIGAPTGLFDGLSLGLEIVQDATGSRTVNWNAIWDFGAAGLPVLQTTAAKADRVFGQYNARTGKIEASFRKGA